MKNDKQQIIYRLIDDLRFILSCVRSVSAFWYLNHHFRTCLTRGVLNRLLDMTDQTKYILAAYTFKAKVYAIELRMILKKITLPVMRDKDLIESQEIDLQHLIHAVHLISWMWKSYAIFDKSLTVKLESQASELRYILDDFTYQPYK